jgi:hypothetical protein
MSDEKRKKTTVTSATKSIQAKTVTDDDVPPLDDYEPSVTWSVFVYWILPVLVIACMTRFAADPDAAVGLGIGRKPIDGSRIPTPTPPVINNAKPPSSYPTSAENIHTLSPTPQRPKKKLTPVPALIADKPSSYIDTVQAINNRRLDWEKSDTDDSGSQSTTTYSTTTSSDNTNSDGATVENKNSNSNSNNNNKESNRMERPPRGPSSDPVRTQLREKIDDLRSEHEVCNVIMATEQN